MILLSMGHIDAMLYLHGTSYIINKEHEPHPYLLMMKFWFMKSFPVFVCPLPTVSKILFFQLQQ